MPLVRINIAQPPSAQAVRAVSAVVYDAMIRVANAPTNGNFRVISRRSPDELVFAEEG